MKGYNVGNGYMGFIEDENDYRLFESEGAYKEYILECNEEI